MTSHLISSHLISILFDLPGDQAQIFNLIQGRLVDLTLCRHVGGRKAPTCNSFRVSQEPLRGLCGQVHICFGMVP
jgi:hypothetical protein